ncbi:MAG: MBL fold metallo-hydrolase [candidate division Zixibacteria bacterium]|nr:MBL fold metallo-hydrolase [candidate division Zixibacteria bacterium]
MIVHPMTLGMFGVNNYLVHSPGSAKALLIDACEDYPSILKKIAELNLELVYLINTHGHGDHIAGNEAIIEKTGAKLLIGARETPYLTDANLNLSAWMGAALHSPPPDRLLNEGDVVELEDIRLEILHTPGHSPGHITLVAEGIAFVGDVIFRESIGRTDFPGGSYETLIDTIRTRIYTLPENTILYNGHGPQTTVAHEKRFNPFVRG